MNELSTYGEGVAAFQKEETREEMEERVRFFAEESDHMQVSFYAALTLTVCCLCCKISTLERREDWIKGRRAEKLSLGS